MNHRHTARGPRVAAFALVALTLATSAVNAQYQPGDIIAAPGIGTGPSSYQLLGVRHYGTVYTIQSPHLRAESIMPSPDNRGLWLTGFGPKHQPGVYNLAPNGSLTTIALQSVRLLGPDGLGGAVGVNGDTVLRVSPGGMIRTIRAFSGGISVIGLDGQTGDLVFGHNLTVQSLKLCGPPITTTLTTIVPDPKSPDGGQGDYDPETDQFVVSTVFGLDGLLRTVRLRPGYRTDPFATIGRRHTALQVRIRPVARQALVAVQNSFHPPPPFWSAEVWDLRLKIRLWTVVKSVYPSFWPWVTAVTAAHSRHLGPLGPAIRGFTFRALVSSPNEPGAAYVVAFSFGMRPAMTVPDGRKIYLQPDALFAYSLTNQGIFSGCRGLLDKNGEAVARVAIPHLQALAGLRIFAVAVTLTDNELRTISDPMGVTIQ